MPTFSEPVAKAMEAKGYVSAAGRIKRREMVNALLDLLTDKHIVDRDDDSLIPEKGVTVRELTEELLDGAWDRDIGLVVSQLCGPDSRVQVALNGDGKMLCGQWTDRVLTAPSGQPVNQRVFLRFVTTANALHTTLRCIVETPYEKELRNMQRLNARIKLAIDRMPALEAVVKDYRQQLQAKAQPLLLGQAS
jgi:hypothetical protein